MGFGRFFSFHYNRMHKLISVLLLQLSKKLGSGKPDQWGFSGAASGKEPACQCRRHKKCGFDPWVRKIPRRRKWQPTPIFLLGKSHGQRSLSGYSLCGHKESDMTEHKLGIKNAVLYFSLPGGGFANCPVREITIFGIE